MIETDCPYLPPVPHRGEINYSGYLKHICEAVAAARQCAVAGDVVLLSPASTSFDMFKNFEERGNTFKRLVEELS